MNFAEKKLLIFDLDGTIADTLYSIMEAVNMCMAHYGFPLKTYDEVRAAVGNGAKNLIMRTMPEAEAQNAERAEEIYRHFQTCYDATHDHIDGCYEGMKEAMLSLRDRGYKTAVLSTDDERIAALSLYYSLGFRPIYEHESHPARWEAVIKTIKK